MAADRISNVGLNNAQNDGALNTLLRYNSPMKKNNAFGARPFSSMAKTAMRHKSPTKLEREQAYATMPFSAQSKKKRRTLSAVDAKGEKTSGGVSVALLQELFGVTNIRDLTAQ